MKSLIPITLLLLTTALQAQDAVIPVEDIEKIRAAKGKEITVRGKISRASKSKSGINFINFPGEKFSVIMFSRDAKKFTDGEPADIYKEGKIVDVTGTVEFYKDKPQIVLTRPTQIRLAPGQEEPPAKEAPKKKKEDPKPVKDEPKKEPEPEKKEEPKVKKKPDPRNYFTD